MTRIRSSIRLLHSSVGIKQWLAEPPSVSAARPACCLVCGAPGAPLGQPLVIVGHGVRERSLLGRCGEEDLGAAGLSVRERRYRCLRCRAVLRVAPRGVLAGRRYNAFAIAFALALFGLLMQGAVAVREQVTSWRAEAHTTNLAWASLRRWVRAVRRGDLFPGLVRGPPQGTLRQVAHRAAMALCGAAPPGLRDRSPELRAAQGGLVVSTRAIGV
jgi:hypothetical protein